MKNDEIKQANRKALPKFLLFAVVCALVGGVIGYFSADVEPDSLVPMMKNAGAFFGIRIAPWLMLALAILVPVVCLPLYRSAKKLAAVWDGEDEDLYNTIDQKLSVVLWLASAAFILALFLITATYSVGMEDIDNANGFVFFFINIAAFFAIMVEATVFQQKCVDTTKQLNPEKRHPCTICSFKRNGWRIATKPRKSSSASVRSRHTPPPISSVRFVPLCLQSVRLPLKSGFCPR